MPKFWEVGYYAILSAAAAVSFLCCYALAFYAVQNVTHAVRARRKRNTVWMPTTRQVGIQTWIVVQLIHHGWFGERILAEQLVDTIKPTEPFYDQKLARKERVAELRAAWLNHGEPETPRI